MSLDLKTRLQELAQAEGFDAFGVAPLEAELRREYYLQWIAEGQHGEMSWLERNNERRLAPENIIPEARSIICLGLNYYQPEPERRGRIAKYALGADYHKTVLQKLKRLCRVMREEFHGDQKPYVDTGPVMEKPIAAQAGLGWQGKSTILLNGDHGTWLFLGFIFTTLELPPDEPAREHCGKCTRCVDACPTQAITGPYQLDARRCISYLTIEHKGAIPLEFRRAIGDRIYGCDECLDVCPWNRWARITQETKFAPRPYPDLHEMLGWTEDDFTATFAGTPIKRAGLSRWRRNVCVALGNIGETDDLPTLRKIADSDDALAAEHAQWAIKEIEDRANALCG
ncbi:tRNA epoxyqueuosine(34) reductase QueG [Cerasicoccus arenae]|uniref:Epoxyqueuosine reductase n=1 Tax=Cerasicoccus arenae TaxID=424488 RepID=A0A8J3DDK4_9BACT|nr:tRNA epoxyqueuosine(34) reductase QueG [Cerasicoccus arenae]MBK1859805.1 tRNA epoxyqueuosine(34) reductase QueG [Cerasicoccus arenae]GHB93710.1 epoxyqueuosine reductase [Cerasicoccus arenae]